MSRVQLFYKNLKNKLVSSNEINQQEKQLNVGDSECQEEQFVRLMKRHTENVLEELKKLMGTRERAYDILDITGGSGENLSFLTQYYFNAHYTLVEYSASRISSAKNRLGKEITYINRNRLQYLAVCQAASFDIIICIWPHKLAQMKTIIEECSRILKPSGKLVIMTSVKDTLPEIITLYHKLFIKYKDRVQLINKKDTLPNSAKEIDRLGVKEGLKTIMCKEAKHICGFASPNRLVRWLTNTGIMQDYEAVLGLENEEVKQSFINMLKDMKIEWVTHSFVYGVWEKI